MDEDIKVTVAETEIISVHIREVEALEIDLDGGVGPQGPPGTPANVWLTGIINPLNTLGNNNDFYLNSTTGDVYQKIAGDWGTPQANLKGPQGDNAIPSGYVL